MEPVTRQKYFRKNGYTLLTWMSAIGFFIILGFTLSYEFPGTGLIVFNSICPAMIVVLQVCGRRAYRNYMKTDKMKWTKQ
jgi:hypothetical protein